jgi:ABC-type oligopeptide transport system ATPase subunit
VVALVGGSGAGKSSVIKLLQRFYLPQAGSVLYDDRDVEVYDPQWLRHRVALVSQEPVRALRRLAQCGHGIRLPRACLALLATSAQLCTRGYGAVGPAVQAAMPDDTGAARATEGQLCPGHAT